MIKSVFTAAVRRFVPVVVGALVAFLAAHGIHVDSAFTAAAVAALGGLAAAGYTALANLLEKYWPKAGWLLGVPARNAR